MTPNPIAAFDPSLDLVIERVVPVAPALIWEAWTTPDHLKHWFVPRPWTTVDCRIDLRPGGEFYTVMRSPEGEEFANAGCYLEVIPGERLVWTDALLPGYRPAPEPFFTAVLTFTPEGNGTRYRAVALHRDSDGRSRHQAMGFEQGWGTVVDQLVSYLTTR